jgi:hypothetical protein
MFFSGEEIRRARFVNSLKIASVSFGWLQGEREFGRLLEGEQLKGVDESSLDGAIDHILRNQRFSRRNFHLVHGPDFLWELRGQVINQGVVSYVLNQPIVIERSPPDWTTLRSLLGNGLQKGTTSALAIFIVVSGDPMMFVKLPGAMIAIGATKALTKWLEKNLPKVMDKAMKKLDL